MRTYETWEMIKMLTENPKLKFKVDTWIDGSILTFRGGSLSLIGGGSKERLSDTMAIGFLNSSYKWQIVHEPVTWQEALQAWIEGKTVRCVMTKAGGEFILRHPSTSPIFNMDWLIVGTWFIEDDADG